VSGGRFGGGAAEILQALVPMMTDLGVDAAWEITGAIPASMRRPRRCARR